MLIKFNLIVFVIAMMVHSALMAQQVEAIDKKGNLVTVNNNRITSGSTAPASPIVNDVWLDVSDPENTRPKIWTGTIWAHLTYSGTPGSIFFTGTDNYPAQDNNNLYWDTENNRLGIGTNTPSSGLDVNGNARIRNLSAGSGSDEVLTSDGNGNLRKLPIANLETKTSITQNTTTGVIMHNSEDGTSQSVNLVSTNANNSIAIGTDGGAYFNNPIKAYGTVVASSGSYIATGITNVVKNGNGRYTVTFSTERSSSNYPIQLTVKDSGLNKVHIYVTAQSTTSFSMAIVDDSGLLGATTYVDKTFYFTVMDL